MAHIDPTLMQQVLDISERERKSNEEHYRQADDLRVYLEALERVGLFHPERLGQGTAPLNRVSLT